MHFNRFFNIAVTLVGGRCLRKYIFTDAASAPRTIFLIGFHFN